MKQRKLARSCLVAGLWFVEVTWPGPAWSHVFPDRQKPGAGVVLEASPRVVQIWFDGDLEPLFSTVTVEDGKGHVLAKGAVESGQPDSTLLQAPLPKLDPGAYQVRWSVVARDGHRTEGQYTFIVKAAP